MRKHTRRKHHDLNAHPVRLAMLSKAPPTEGELLALRAGELLALGALVEGRATVADLFSIGRRVKVAAHMAREGVGPEVLALVGPCRRVLDLARHDPAAAGRDAAGLAAVREVLDLHDQQRCALTPAQFEALQYAAIHHGRW